MVSFFHTKSAWRLVLIVSWATPSVLLQLALLSPPASFQRIGRTDMKEFDRGSRCLCVSPQDSEASCSGIINTQYECTSFPKDFNVRFAHAFRVHTTNITSLRAGDLDKMRHLNDLAVNNACRLTRIEPGFFRGMVNLAYLSLSSNRRLTHLDENTFEGLVSLAFLRLEDDGFKRIENVAIALSPMMLPDLLLLDLDGNSFESISMNEFRAMEGSRVSEVYLTSCYLHYIHPQALEPLSNLLVFKVGGNHNLNLSLLADAIDHRVKLGKSLFAVGLDSVGFNPGLHRKLLMSIGAANVTDLVLSDNLMEETTTNTFPAMLNLQYLNLSKVHLQKISNGTFGRNVMPSLEELNLCCNKLSEATPAMLPEQVLHLDLSSNTGTRDYFIPRDNLFANMTSLKHLCLSNNKLVILGNQTFTGLVELETLYLDNAAIFRVDHGAFDFMRKLEFLSLQKNRLMSNFFHPEMFSGLIKLKELLLGENGFTNLGEYPNLFTHLTSLSNLGLQKNRLKVLDNTIFHSLPFLISVDLSENQISSWQCISNFDQNQIRYVNASWNNLTIPNEFLLRDLDRVGELDLTGNPFHCDCELIQTLEALVHNNRFTVDKIASLPKFLRLSCRYPQQWYGQSILTFTTSNTSKEVCTRTDTSTPFSLPFKILLALLFLLAGLFLFCFRKRVCTFYFWIRNTVRSQRRPMIGNDQEMGPPTSYQYDAFVSYSKEDGPFVLKMVSMLEEHEPFFRMCVYERDFSIGATITDAVVNSVTSSRKVLLVVSDSFTRSNWCNWETHVAHYQRVSGGYSNEEGLLVIKLGHIHESDLSPTLRYLLRTKVYLEYDPDPSKQQMFWRKLRDALAKKSQRELSASINAGCDGHAVGLHS